MSQRLSRRAEDYLRIIYEIIENRGYVRVKDISMMLGVRPPTAVGMLRKLHQQGLIIYEKYGGITLTARGREIAEAVKKRHDIFIKFLEILSVPEEIALEDAHVLEHQLHPVTVRQIAKFVEFLTRASETGYPKFATRFLEAFRHYCSKE